LPGDLLKCRAGHPHEAFAHRRGQFSTFRRCRDVALNEYVAVFGQDCRRAHATGTELRKGSIFTNDFLNFHIFLLFLYFSFLNQNRGFWFIGDNGGGFV
jgi:hypothetical protein